MHLLHAHHRLRVSCTVSWTLHLGVHPLATPGFLDPYIKVWIWGWFALRRNKVNLRSRLRSLLLSDYEFGRCLALYNSNISQL
jgi:hypothetical protein